MPTPVDDFGPKTESLRIDPQARSILDRYRAPGCTLSDAIRLLDLYAAGKGCVHEWRKVERFVPNTRGGRQAFRWQECYHCGITGEASK